MTIEQAVIAQLKWDPTLGGMVGTRVFGAGLLAQAGALPAITAQRISTVPFHTHQGPAGVSESRWQVVVWASTMESAAIVADAVQANLDCFSGSLAGVVPCGRVKMANRVDRGRDSESLLFSQQMDFILLFGG